LQGREDVLAELDQDAVLGTLGDVEAADGDLRGDVVGDDCDVGKLGRVADRVLGGGGDDPASGDVGGKVLGEVGVAGGIGRRGDRAEVALSLAVATGVGGRRGVDVDEEAGGGGAAEFALDGGRGGGREDGGDLWEVLAGVGPASASSGSLGVTPSLLRSMPRPALSWIELP
jgi:hypothetical protein